jgi:Chaperone of endosialidase
MKKSITSNFSPLNSHHSFRSFIRRYSAFILLALACFALLPRVEAVSPPPDGGYPGGNTAEGQGALSSRITGTYNTALGLLSLTALTDGTFCTGVGAGTLLLNTADQNTATGAGALLSNTIGFENTASGAFALFSNTEGADNTAVGNNALFNNTTATGNTAIGDVALFSNIDGYSNVAVGIFALYGNTTGSYNNALGAYALQSNVDGSENEAFGETALASVTSGSQNVAIGDEAGIVITTGSGNTLIGKAAGLGLTGSDSGNICLGADVDGVAGANNTTWIRNVYDSVATDRIVYVNSDGKLGTLASSRRFKDEIKPMDKMSEALFDLKPVTFRYKKEIDSSRAPQFGLVAEEVAKVSPDLVVRDRQGQVYSVRYEAVNAMLLNEFLKEHRKVEQLENELKGTVGHLQQEVQGLTANLKERAKHVANTNRHPKTSKPATQLAVNNP